MSSTTLWIPDSGVTNHAGQPILENSNFFVIPPLEIGRVISAETTLNGQKSIAHRFTISALLIIATLVVFLTPLIIFSPVFMIFAVYRFNQANRHACSYVGENGFARFTAKGRRLLHPKSMIFCFQDDMAMYASRTEIILNGSYRNTLYCFTWKRDGKKIHEFNGRFNKYKDLQPDHPFSLACAAEAAWTYDLQRKMPNQLDIFGYVEFPVEGRFKAIRIGEGFVEFMPNKGEPQRFLESQIKMIRQYNGSLEFVPHDLKLGWLFNKYDLKCDKIGNLQLLLVSMKSLLEIRIT
jgi:hypothetical protein